jgi:hypothetical protein
MAECETFCWQTRQANGFRDGLLMEKLKELWALGGWLVMQMPFYSLLTQQA